MSVNAIGYFQFNNLIQSRTPFLLICLEGVDVGHWYQHVFKMHYDSVRMSCGESEVLTAINEKKFAHNFSIVVLDKSGKMSSLVSQKLEASGYINSFYVEGGVQGLEQEKNTLF